MFTGIIRQIGTIESVEQLASGARITVRHGFDPPLTRGESVAVAGVCLTVLPDSPERFHADLSPETLARTTLGSLGAGDRLNLERALTLADRLGGHLVQGHVDAVGHLEWRREDDEFATFRWTYPSEYADLVVDKGSIAIDGVSLTIVEPDDHSFAVALIPETLEKTTLDDLQPGSPSNLEFDVMAKHARQLFLRYLGRDDA